MQYKTNTSVNDVVQKYLKKRFICFRLGVYVKIDVNKSPQHVAHVLSSRLTSSYNLSEDNANYCLNKTSPIRIFNIFTYLV